jgi:outer membrane protein assembly factor BamB
VFCVSIPCGQRTPPCSERCTYEDIVIGMEKMMSMGAILASPVVVDNVIYFGSTDGKLYAVN